MKRLGSTSSNAAPSSSTKLVDHNGKDKKHQRTPIGKLIVVIVVLAVCSVFLLPFMKLILGDTVRSASATAPAKSNTQQQTLQIPPCPSSPWKENENLQGKCPGDLKPYPDATTISQCASTCCVNADCVSWQFRDDIGCIQGWVIDDPYLYISRPVYPHLTIMCICSILAEETFVLDKKRSE